MNNIVSKVRNVKCPNCTNEMRRIFAWRDGGDQGDCVLYQCDYCKRVDMDYNDDEQHKE
jgi:hypothetical protein